MDVNTSAPEAKESMSRERRAAPRLGSFRISSKSSRKPSATEAIQNFLNLAFNSCSLAGAVPEAGMKEGIAVGGGDGEGNCLVCTRGSSATFLVGSGRPLVGTESESESDSDDDEDSDGAGMGSFGSGSSSEGDENDDEEEDEDAARLFLFLLRLFGAGGLAGAVAAIVVR